PEQRLVPPAAARYVADPDDRPRALHFGCLVSVLKMRVGVCIPAQLRIFCFLCRAQYFGLIEMGLKMRRAKLAVDRSDRAHRSRKRLARSGFRSEQFIEPALLFDQSRTQLARPHLHSTEYLVGPGPLRRCQCEPVGQFKNMSRTRIAVELGRLRESHALAVDVAGLVLLRQRFDI